MPAVYEWPRLLGDARMTELTDRQKRELEYHVGHAKKNENRLDKPFDWEIIENPRRRWWNAHWQMYTYLMSCDLKNKNILVVGCGFGEDALNLARLGANVSAFDLSPDSLEIAKGLAAREGLNIDFRQMPAEKLQYPDSQFDYVLARDILHHVDIPPAIDEVVRVSKPGALFVVNEIYSHSFTDKIRRSALVEKIVYPAMLRFIYGSNKPYITEDERKLSETDVRIIRKPLCQAEFFRYFNFIVTRLLPDRIRIFAKLDQMLLRVLGPMGFWVAGRVMFSARINK